MAKYHLFLKLVCIFLMTGFVKSTTETPAIPGDCQKTVNVDNGICKRFNTPLPSKYFSCENLSCLERIFKRMREFDTYDNDEHICNLVFPSCVNNTLQIPCRRYCKDGFSRVGGNSFEYVCDLLPESPCYDLTHSVVPIYGEGECTDHQYCEGTGFDSTLRKIKQYRNKTLPWDAINNCSDPFLARFFLCGTKFPNCITGLGTKLFPCNEYCVELMKKCPFLKLNCEKLWYENEEWQHACFDPTSGPKFSLKSTTKKFKRVVPAQPANFWCDPVSQWKCDNRMCIPKSDLCDGIYDCPDKSDEKDSCECKHNQFKCRNSYKCYMEQWICDGQRDCPDGDDESNCTCSSIHDWRCVNGDCIPRFQKCDGTAHCADHSDEMKCLFIDVEDNTLLVNTEENGPMKLCSHGFEEFVAKDACRKLGQGALRTLTHKKDTTKSMKILLHNLGATSTTLGQGNMVDSCLNNWIVVLECHPKISTDGIGNTLLVSTVQDGVMAVCFEGFSEKDAKVACEKLGQGGFVSFTNFEGVSSYSKFVLNPLAGHKTVLGSGYIVQSCIKNMLVQLTCLPQTCDRSKILVPPANIESSTFLKWPWIAIILLNKSIICVATIIDKVLLYTSANCVRYINDFKNVRVATGTKFIYTMEPFQYASTQNNYNVLNIIVPSQNTTNNSDSDHDVAVVLLKGSIVFNHKTKPLCRQSPDDVFSRANDCYMAGWGQSLCTSIKSHLRHRKLTLWDTKKCNSSLLLNGTLRPNEGCAEFYNGVVAIGKRDSGSPIFCNDEYGIFKLVGILPNIKDDCLETTIITFSRVEDVTPWINKELEKAAVFVCDNKKHLYRKELICNNHDDCGDRSDESKQCNVSFNCSFDDDFLCGYTFKSGYHRKFYALDPPETIKDPLFDHTKGIYPGHWIRPLNEMVSPKMNLTEQHCARFYYHLRGESEKGFAVFHFDGKKMEKKWDVQETFQLDTWLMGMFEVSPGPFEIIFVSYNAPVSVDDTLLIKGSCESVCLKGEFKCLLLKKIICLPEELKCNIISNCDNAVDESNCNYNDRNFTCTFDNGNLCGLMQLADSILSDRWLVLPPTLTEKFQDNNKRYKEVSGALLSLDTTDLEQNESMTLVQYLRLNNLAHCLKFFYKSNAHATFQIYLMSSDGNILYLQQAYKKQKPHKWRVITANIPANLEKATLYYEVIKTESLGPPSSIQLDYITIVRGECEKRNNTGPEIAKTVWTQRVCTRNETKCEDGNCIPIIKNCDGNKDCPFGLDEGKVCKKRRSISCYFTNNFLCGYSGFPTDIDNISETASRLTFKRNTKSFSKLRSSKFTHKNQSLTITYFAYNPEARENKSGTLKVYNVAENTTLLWSTKATNEKSWKKACFPLPYGETRLYFEPIDAKKGRMTFCIDNLKLSKSPCKERV